MDTFILGVGVGGVSMALLFYFQDTYSIWRARRQYRKEVLGRRLAEIMQEKNNKQ